MPAVSIELQSILDGINSPSIVIIRINCSGVMRKVRIGRKCMPFTITEAVAHRRPGSLRLSEVLAARLDESQAFLVISSLIPHPVDGWRFVLMFMGSRS